MNNQNDIKFELNRLTNYSDEDILSEIQRVAEIINRPFLTIREFSQHSKVHDSTIRRRFGN